MSPRAAARLEHLGFDEVFDYAAGKEDWSGAGMDRAGRLAVVPTSADLARDVPTCRLQDRIEDALMAMERSGLRQCAVVDDDGTVHGVVERSDVPDDASGSAGDHMIPGPTTVRGNETLASLEELVDRMNKAGVSSILVTDADGRLIGSLRRDDAAEALQWMERAARDHQHA